MGTDAPGRFGRAGPVPSKVGDEGAQTIATRTLLQCGVDISCLSEVRLPDCGHRVIPITETNRVYHLYDSGLTGTTDQQGVSIALSETALLSLLEWGPIFSRLARMRLRGRVHNLTVLEVLRTNPRR